MNKRKEQKIPKRKKATIEGRSQRKGKNCYKSDERMERMGFLFI